MERGKEGERERGDSARVTLNPIKGQRCARAVPRSPPPPPPPLNSVGHLQVMLRNEADAASRLLAAAADNALGFSVIRPLSRRSSLVQAQLKLPGFGSRLHRNPLWRTDWTPESWH